MGVLVQEAATVGPTRAKRILGVVFVAGAVGHAAAPWTTAGLVPALVPQWFAHGAAAVTELAVGVPRPDPTRPVEPTLTLRLRVDGHTASFLSTLTVFSAPQQAWVQELLMESFFPLDPETEAFCRARAAEPRET